MRLGLISDIHADHAALSRALSLLEKGGAERVVCMGDMVEKGPLGDVVISTLREEGVLCVRGNHDDNAVRRFHDGDEDEENPLLHPESVAFIEALPAERAYRWDGARVLIAHIAPCGIREGVEPDCIPRRLKRAMRSLEVDVVVLGHTHTPMKVRYGDIWFVNPGSVARTRSRDSATCAILELPSVEMTVLSLR